MDEGAGNKVFDRSGNGNHGFYNGTSSQTWMDGKIGGALRFDGVDDFVEAPTIDISSWSGITVSAWVSWKSIVNDEHTIVGNSHSADPGFNFYLEPDCTNCIESYIRTEPDTLIGGEFNDLNLTDDVWSHVVMTYDLSTMKAYLNTQVSGITFSGGIIDQSVPYLPIGIGRNPDTEDKYFQGLIDEVRIYDRALSADEVKRLYNMGR